MGRERKKAGNHTDGRRADVSAVIPQTVVLLAALLLLAGLAAGFAWHFFGDGMAKEDEAITAAQPQKTENEKAESQIADRGIPTASGVSYIPQKDRQPVLSMGQKPGVLYITWKGSKRGPQYLRYAEDKYSLPATKPIKAQRARILNGDYYRYKVEITGLKEGRLYYYEIGDGVAFDSPRFFYAPDDSGQTVFAYLGDPQVDKSLKEYEDWSRLVWNMYKNNNDIEFVITGGDMVNIPARESHWNGFLDNCGLFGMIPMMTIPGNHEGVTTNATYKKLFRHIRNGPTGSTDEAFYYFEYGNCRFIMLDSSFLTGARQKTMGKALWSARAREVERWLRKILADSDKPWNIVVTHHPVYGMHDVFTVSPEIRRRWLPIMEEEGVDLVLCGHQHVYMRSEKIDGIVHIMGNSGGKKSNYYSGFNQPDYAAAIYAAGANYQVIRADGKKLELTSYDSSNVVVDSFSLRKNRWSEIF